MSMTTCLHCGLGAHVCHVPPTPPLDQETLAASLHKALTWQYDECDHGTYSGGPSHGQPYAMCEILARRVLSDSPAAKNIMR